MGCVATSFQQWWAEKGRKYGWENIKGRHREIDFDTCSIYLK
jgi:CXXX repeat modification system protein